MEAFFDIERLSKDRGFLLSLGSSILAAIALVTVAAAIINTDKLQADPIGHVKLVTRLVSEDQNVKVFPISSIKRIADTKNADFMILSGYVAKLADICENERNIRPLQDAVLLLRQNNGYTAVTADIDERNCTIFTEKSSSSKDNVYAAADVPFKSTRSAKEYLIVDHGQR